VRSPGAKGLSVKRKAAISRRQFLTGAFRGREAAPSETEAPPALPSDLAQGKLAEHYCFAWNEEPKIPDWDKRIDGVLEEMENLKGIEDF
jgi:hypothetical protein